MKDNNTKKIITIEIVQTGDLVRIHLSKMNLKKKFNEILIPIFKDLKLKQKDTYLSSEDGKMVSNLDLNLLSEEIIKKFGMKLKLYYEKVL